VTGPNGSGGAILNFSYTPTPVYTVTITNSTGGSVAPGSGSFSGGTVLTYTATPSVGFDFVSWDGSIISQVNPLTFTLNANTGLRPTFLPHLYTDDIETGNLTKLNWTVGGNIGWSVQQTNASQTNTIVGKKFFVKSGAIGNNQISLLTLTTTNIAGSGSFAYRVSSEAGWDFLEFYLNNTNVATTNNRLLKVSGDSGWATFTFNVPAGVNRFQWRYTKDAGNSDLLDAAFVDNIDLPLVVPKDATTPATFNFISQTGTNVEFRVYGQTNQLYIIQASADLANWTTVSTNVAVHGIIQMIQPQDPEMPQRFFRAISP
jgi:hypothetical protein